jgi:TolA-binding protein
MSKVSVHVRGETYGELGVAYRSLGNKAEAIKAFEMVEKLTPNTEYALKAKNERQKLIDDSAR